MQSCKNVQKNRNLKFDVWRLIFGSGQKIQEPFYWNSHFLLAAQRNIPLNSKILEFTIFCFFLILGYHQCTKEEAVTLAALIYRVKYSESKQELQMLPQMLRELVPTNLIKQLSNLEHLIISHFQSVVESCLIKYVWTSLHSICGSIYNSFLDSLHLTQNIRAVKVSASYLEHFFF